MGISEKLGYVRGLADGLGVKDATPEGRLLLAVIDLLGDMTQSMVEMGMMVQDLEESVEDLITDVYDDDDDDDDDDESHIRFFPGSHSGEDVEDEDGEGDPSCVNCGAPVAITREVLLEGRVTCPECGQQMMLDIQDGHGSCGCGGCGHSHGHDDKDDGQE